MREAFEFWDREVDAPVHVSWMENAEVRRYIQRSISGDVEVPGLDWFQQRMGRRFERALSIGCGTGALEREILRRDLCSVIDAFDGSLGSLRTARAEAEKVGYEGRVRYFAADFDRVALPAMTYDAVFVHQALHHVTELESLFAAILMALRPDGILYFDEYVGPSRTDWTERMLSPHRRIYAALPAGARLKERLLLPIQPDDPSEGVRSSDILGVLGIGFEAIERRDYGGNLLSVLFPEVDWARAPAALVPELIAREQEMLASGAPSFYTVVVARPKRDPDAVLRRYSREARTSRVRRRVMRASRAVTHFGRRVAAAVRRRVLRLPRGTR